jgi:hypothetical protein
MRKLHLNRETLTELTAGELASMAAGVNNPTPVVITLPPAQCVSNRVCVDVAATITACVTEKVSLNCPSALPTCYCTPIPL